MFQKIYVSTIRESTQNKVFKVIVVLNMLLSIISGYTGGTEGINFNYSTGVWPLFFGQIGVILCLDVIICRTMSYIIHKNGTFDLEKCTQLDLRVFVVSKYAAYLTIAVVMQIVNTIICVIKTYLIYSKEIHVTVAKMMLAVGMKYLCASLPLMIFMIALLMFLTIGTKSVVFVSMISIVSMVLLALHLPNDCWYLPTYQMLRMCTTDAYVWKKDVFPPASVLCYSGVLILLAVGMLFGVNKILRRAKS